MRQLVFILCVLLSIGTLAQSHVRVHYKNGTRADIPIETIDSLTFVEGTVDSAC